MNIPGSILYDSLYDRILILLGKDGEEFAVIKEGKITKLTQTLLDGHPYDLEYEFSRHSKQHSRRSGAIRLRLLRRSSDTLHFSVIQSGRFYCTQYDRSQIKNDRIIRSYERRLSVYEDVESCIPVKGSVQ